MMPSELEAIKIALYALYQNLPEEEQVKIADEIMRPVIKHGLDGKDEELALEILRGY